MGKKVRFCLAAYVAFLLLASFLFIQEKLSIDLK